MENEELLEFIKQWIYHNEKLRQLNKYLYEHTELFEKRRMIDFPEELYGFFAGKITRFTKDYNKLYSLLTFEEQKKLNKMKLLEK